jgi:glycine/D-amino acid oxidase-like deaminating enzyme
VKDLFPLRKTDDILAGFYVKEDGRADPVGVTMALAKGARMQGAKIIENVPVTGSSEARRGPGVRTAHGDIEAEYVVNCAGMWARQLGALAASTSRLSRGALLPHHREDPRAVERAAGARGSWIVRLLPRGGRAV